MELISIKSLINKHIDDNRDEDDSVDDYYEKLMKKTRTSFVLNINKFFFVSNFFFSLFHNMK